MLRRIRASWTSILALLFGLAVAGFCLALLAAWSGVYNVAASSGHWAVVDAMLRFGMKNSVERRAPDVEPPPLDDPDLIRLGAAHFYGGCAYCHGAPGDLVDPIAEGMLPPPPDLGDHVGMWTDQELFWIVKHGIKYAGMPAWAAQERNDEVWALVAFLRRLPDLEPQAYRELALGEVTIEASDGRELATGQRANEPIQACARCHGAEDRPPLSALAPRLHGQPQEMLMRALQAYAAGERYSGIMQPIAAGLSARSMQVLSTYYSGLPPLAPRQPAPGQAELVEAGRRLATQGNPDAEIPACVACHSATALPLYPRLAGQHAPYMANQLRAWQSGEKGRTDTNAVMAPIARRLSERQIIALTVYFESLPADAAAEGLTAP